MINILILIVLCGVLAVELGFNIAYWKERHPKALAKVTKEELMEMLDCEKQARELVESGGTIEELGLELKKMKLARAKWWPKIEKKYNLSGDLELNPKTREIYRR